MKIHMHTHTLMPAVVSAVQGKAVLKFIEAIAEKTLRCTAVMTAARGRGKSAALGLAMASSIAFGYLLILLVCSTLCCTLLVALGNQRL